MPRHELQPRRLAIRAACSLIALGTSARVAFAINLQDTQPVAPETAPAAGAATAPGTDVQGVEPLQVTITGVEGLVQVRAAEDQPWQRAAVGMVLAQDAEFRTGPKSAVRFVLPPDQVITLDRLGTVKVVQAINDGGRIRTNLGMKYGRTRYDIEAAGREHESTISSPSSTLAVRGTRFSLTDERPFPPRAVSLTGRVAFRHARKRVEFGAPGAGRLEVAAGDDSPAETALATSYVDPGAAAARTPSESQLIASLLYSGAQVSYDYDKGIRVVRGGQPPRTDAELIPTLPGTLNFVLRWTGNSDLNLGVAGPPLNPQNETNARFVYPLGKFARSETNGRTAFDHRGGRNGGIEVVFWPRAFPQGLYPVFVQHMSGPAAPATVDVFLGTQRLDLTTSMGPVPTVQFTSEPTDRATQDAFFAGFVRTSPADLQAGGNRSAASVTSAAPVKAPTVRGAVPKKVMKRR